MIHNGIHASLSVNLKHRQCLKTTVIQNYAIPILLSERDIIARTPTGSGKTVNTNIYGINEFEMANKSINVIPGDRHVNRC